MNTRTPIMSRAGGDDARTPLEIATAPLVTGEVVWMFGNCGPFRVIHKNNDEALLCNEEEWQRDQGRHVLETVEGGTPISTLSRARGDDNSVGRHLRDGTHLHTLCGRILVINLEGEVEGASYETSHAHCEECLEMYQVGRGPVVLEPSDPLRKLMTDAIRQEDSQAARIVLHDAFLERFPTEYGASIADAEAQASARKEPFAVAVRPVATLNAAIVVRPAGRGLGTRLSPRGMTDERAQRLLKAIALLEETIWTGAVVTYVADPL